MKKLWNRVLAVVLFAALLVSVCHAEEDSLAAFANHVLGSDRVGYLQSDGNWFTMRSSNLTDEAIAELEEKTGFMQYMNIDLGFVILSMSRIDNVVDGELTALEVILRMANTNAAYSAENMIDPQFNLTALGERTEGMEWAFLSIYDQAEESEAMPLLFFYGVSDQYAYMYEFEGVYDNETAQALLEMIDTFTLVNPAA